MKYRNFIKSDIDKILESANFNDDQLKVFQYITSPAYGVTLTNLSIAMKMSISDRRFYSIKREVDSKIKRILG